MNAFVLTPSVQVVAGVPQVHLHAVLETGEPALIVLTRARPYCFVRRVDLDRARAQVGHWPVEDTTLVTMADEPVVRVTVATPGDLPVLRRRLEGEGIPTFEADVRFPYRVMIDAGVCGAFAVDGPHETAGRTGRCYRDPVLRPASWAPTLRVLSLDVETTPDAGRLLSIAVAGTGGDRVWLVGTGPVAGAEVVPDERTLLTRFLAHVAVADPDVLTGWNVVEFDLATLQARARDLGMALPLGRSEAPLEIERDASFTRDPRATLDGRVVLDGLALVRGSYVRLDDYRLETAARTLLGKGKLVTAPDRAAEILRLHREDPAALAAYNLVDAQLVLEILARLNLVALTVRRSLMTGMQLDRVGAQIAAIDSLYLRELRARGRVAATVRSESPADAGITGGLVLESVPGLHRHILVFDFTSLYPSLIRTLNIDPLTYLADPGDRDVVRSPSGAAFRREEGILPALVARLWAERDAAKRAGDAVASQATKILMNSLFGVLGAPASRLFAPAVANAITVAGQHVIRLAAQAAETRGHRVIYGDTDSLFVDVGATSVTEARRVGDRLRARIEADVAEALERSCGCKSHLVLAFQKVYTRFFMPEIRGAAAGSKKRYAGLSDDDLEIVGLEAVRRDWSPIARRFQRELLGRVLRDQPVSDFVTRFVTEVRAGGVDTELVYRKALRRPAATYTKTTPPHVQAARKAGIATRGTVRYVVTTAGPEPEGRLTAPPDHEHYVVHQLKPIADAVLRFVPGPDFDTMTGLRRQLSLF